MKMFRRMAPCVLAAITLIIGLAGSLPAATNVVQVRGPTIYGFVPAVLNVTIGDTVLWTNVSSTTHDVTHGSRTTGITPNPYWSSINLGLLGKSTVTFSDLGSYPYVCNQHVFVIPQPPGNPTQTGQVNVLTFNFPPTVNLTAPSSGLEPATVTLTATASDQDGTVTNIQLFVGANLVGESTTSPVTATVEGLPGGNYSLTAKAVDDRGSTNTSAPVSLVVDYRVNYFDLAFSPAVLRIKAGESILFTNTGGFHTVTGSGTEPFCGPGAAQFCRTTLTTAGSYPYRCVFHSIDQSAGMTGTVSVATFNRAPAVAMTSPASNITVPAGVTLTVRAQAIDPDGSITTVQFVNGTALLSSDITSPYSHTLVNPTQGVYSITARAADNLGLRSTSAPVVITVVAPVEFRLSSPGFAEGAFQFQYNASIGQQYVVEGSLNTDGPSPFVPLSTNVATTNVVTFTDPASTSRSGRSYRVFRQP